MLVAFLGLGLTSFGGPIAHLGYFRTAFVERRRWLDDAGYADLVALCQFLPGPSSSQVGFAIGLARAGWPGALAAWFGFTLPSAVLMMGFAFGLAHWPALAASGAIHGLKVVAVAVVAQAVWGMARSLCPDRMTAGIAIAAAVIVLMLPSAPGQIAALAFGAVAGHWLAPVARPPASLRLAYRVSPAVGLVAIAAFLALLVALPLVARAGDSQAWSVLAVFYQSGALVFGGGHVILPLLQSGLVPAGWIDNGTFLAGYAVAQAVPGPLTSFAAFLGTVIGQSGSGPPGAVIAGLVCLITIFLPAFLLLVGALPFWDAWRQRQAVQRLMTGINAAVVGILGAALYDPVFSGTIQSRADFSLALAAFGLLVIARLSPVWVVIAAAVTGWTIAA